MFKFLLTTAVIAALVFAVKDGMPKAERKFVHGKTLPWELPADYPMAGFVAATFIFLITYVLERKTRRGPGRQFRWVFRTLMLSHFCFLLFIIHTYSRQQTWQ